MTTLKNQKGMRKLLIKKQLCKHCGKKHPIIQNCNLKDVTQPVNQEGTMKKPTNKPDPKISKQRVIEMFGRMKKTIPNPQGYSMNGSIMQFGERAYNQALSDAIQKIKEVK